MLKITIDLWPGGCEAKKRTLGTAEIANLGTSTETYGNYEAVFSTPRRKRWRVAHLAGFPRKRQNAWELLLSCLILARKESGPHR